MSYLEKQEKLNQALNKVTTGEVVNDVNLTLQSLTVDALIKLEDQEILNVIDFLKGLSEIDRNVFINKMFSYKFEPHAEISPEESDDVLSNIKFINNADAEMDGDYELAVVYALLKHSMFSKLIKTKKETTPKQRFKERMEFKREYTDEKFTPNRKIS